MVLLAIVLIKGVISPVGQPIDTGIANPFGTAILTAYNTGDLTVGILFASVILLDLRRRGYDDKACKRGGFLAGIVCIVVLFAVYGTLTYIGACASATYPQDTAQTALLSGIIREIMGTAGMACLGCAVALACLTTAVGIGTTAVGFFYEFFKQKVPYKVLMLIACLIGVFMGITGVQNIVNYVTPLFLLHHRHDRSGPAQQLPAQRRPLQGRRADGRGGEPGRRGAQRQPQHRLAAGPDVLVPLLRHGLLLAGALPHRHGGGCDHLPGPSQVSAPFRRGRDHPVLTTNHFSVETPEPSQDGSGVPFS